MSTVVQYAPRSALPLRLAVASYLSLYILFWTAIPLLLQEEPPIDNFEQLTWALHPSLGYDKHPPLPTLLLWLFEQVAPAGIPLTYVLGAMQVLFTLAAAYWIGCLTLDRARARLGALTITCISYHTLRMHFYNHNTALLCATAMSMLCVWQAVRSGRIGWWLALGVAWAAGMLSKYQMVLTIVCNLTFAAVVMRTRPALLLRGSIWASVIGLALFSPHAIWLIQHDFPTFRYAAGTLDASLPFAARWDSLLRFGASQMLRLAPAGVALIVLRRMEADPSVIDSLSYEDVDSARFWRIHAFGPLLIMASMAVLGGVDLEMHWGTAFLWTLPLWYLSTPRGKELGRLSAGRMLAIVAAVQVLLICGKTLFPNA